MLFWRPSTVAGRLIKFATDFTLALRCLAAEFNKEMCLFISVMFTQTLFKPNSPDSIFSSCFCLLSSSSSSLGISWNELFWLDFIFQIFPWGCPDPPSEQLAPTPNQHRPGHRRQEWRKHRGDKRSCRTVNSLLDKMRVISNYTELLFLLEAGFGVWVRRLRAKQAVVAWASLGLLSPAVSRPANQGIELFALSHLLGWGEWSTHSLAIRFVLDAQFSCYLGVAFQGGGSWARAPWSLPPRGADQICWELEIGAQRKPELRWVEGSHIYSQGAGDPNKWGSGYEVSVKRIRGQLLSPKGDKSQVKIDLLSALIST